MTILPAPEKQKGLEFKTTLGCPVDTGRHPYPMSITKITKLYIFMLSFRCYFLRHCSSGWPGTHYVDQNGLELTEIHLSLPLNAGIKGASYYTWLDLIFILCKEVYVYLCARVCVYIYIYVCVCTCVLCICVHNMCAVLSEARRGCQVLSTGVTFIAHHHMGAGTSTWVLCKNK